MLLLFLFSHSVMWGQSTYKVNTQKLNVRSAPSTKAAVVGSLKMGETVKVKSISGGWATISYGGKTCYVSASLLKQENQKTSASSSKSTKQGLTQNRTAGNRYSASRSTSRSYRQSKNSVARPALWNFTVGGMSHSSYGESLFDWSLMLGGDIPISLKGKPFPLETGLRYLSQKMIIQSDFDGWIEDNRGYEGRASVLEVPLRLAYDLPLSNNLALRLSAGPYISWLLSGPGGFNFGIEPSVALKYKYVSLGLQFAAPLHQGFKNEYSSAPMLTFGIRFKSSAWKYIGDGLVVASAGLSAAAESMNSAAYGQQTVVPSVSGFSDDEGGISRQTGSVKKSKEVSYEKCPMCNGTGHYLSQKGTRRAEHNMYHLQNLSIEKCDYCGKSHCDQCMTASAHVKCPKCQGKGKVRR